MPKGINILSLYCWFLSIYLSYPLHKIQGYQGHQNVTNCKPHHSGDICTTRGNNLKTSFSFMGQNVKKKYILGLFWGPWEGLQWSDWAYLAFQLSSHPYLCTCEIRKQYDKKFLSLNPKYEEQKYFFHIWGVLGGALRQTQVNKHFRAVRPHNRADQFITREKIITSFSYMDPNVKKIAFWAIRGGPGWPINNQTGPILLPRHPLTYINIHI